MNLRSRSATGALLGLALVTVFLLLLLDRRPVVFPLTTRFLEDKVFAGRPVTVQWTVIVYRYGCGGVDNGIWIDSEGTVFYADPLPIPPRNEPQQIGKRDHTPPPRQRTVPAGMKPGVATFVDLPDRWCNPIQQWLWPMRDDSVPRVNFTISKP